MTDHEIPKNQWTQDSLFPSDNVVPLGKAQIQHDTTPESEALEQASVERRYVQRLEDEEDRRDRRGDNSVDDGYWRGPSNVPRMPVKKRKPTRRRSVHLRHDGPSESDEFHNTTGGYLSRTPEELAAQQVTDRIGKAGVLAALEKAQAPPEPLGPSPEEAAAALQEALEKQHAAVNASWDAIEEAIAKKNS